MGRHRNKNKTQSQAQISEKIRKLYNCDLQELYEAWFQYHSYVVNGTQPDMALKRIEKEFSRNVVNYFAVIGLNHMLNEYLAVEKCNG